MNGKIAVITGASRGIGAALAELLGASGVKVALLARTKSDLDKIAAKTGGLAVPCDVSDANSVKSAAKIIRAELGEPDILVNNAGIFQTAPMDEMSLEMFGSVLQTNLIAPFYTLHEFLPAMKQRGSGHIVTIGTVADRKIFPENGAYSAAKYGLRAMHEVMRLELRGSGVRCTLVSPGAVDTALWDGRTVYSPRSQMLTALEVADAVMYALRAPERVNIDELRLTHS